MSEYDPDNIFAKIIDGKIPCFKVYESKASLAMLDAFPMVEGHTLIIPKAKGYTDLLTMPPRQAAEFMSDVQKVAKAVQAATGCSGVNLWQNCGADSGQTVFHPHMHIVPRKEGDGLHKYPASAKEMLAKDIADPVMSKIVAALNPPAPLRKPKFGNVSSVRPGGTGLNLKLKLVEEPKEVEGGKGQKFFEVLAGDASGSVVVSLHENQRGGLTAGKTITIQNGSVLMVKQHIRMTVDKWGKIEESSEPLEEEVNKAKNVSETEYELVKS